MMQSRYFFGINAEYKKAVARSVLSLTLNKLTMKTTLLHLCAASVIFLGACNSNTPKKQDSAEVAEEHNEQKMDDTHMEDDAEFVVKAMEGGLLEVEMGKLAAQKGMMADVKSFGSMMAEHHTKIGDELKSLAASKNITVPTALGEDKRDMMEKMTRKTGRDFDEAYIDEMIDAHKKDIKLFEDKASDDKADADLRRWASETLPTLRSHLTEIQRIDEKFDAMKK
jgi:putative membrane protein